MTKISVVELSKKPLRAGLAAYFLPQNSPFENLPFSSPSLKHIAKRENFEARKDQTLLLLQDNPALPRILLVGLGKATEFDLETLRKAACRAARQARDLKAGDTLFVLPAEAPKNTPAAAMASAAAEGAWLGLYKYREFFSKSDERKDPVIQILVPGSRNKADVVAAVERSRVVCESVLQTRDLVNRPPSDLTPLDFGRIASGLKAPGLAVNVLPKKRLEQLKMGGLLGVSRGSDKPPVFVHLTYRPRGRKARRKVVLVGKGITFDSGGLSLKPANSMEDMKCDMSGAAAVLGILLAAAKLGLPVEVHGLCAVSENMPGPDAVKPGDVLTAMNGKTMEVLNTDAEGRLVLADALCYGANLKPDVMIDMATLTGAAIVALGAEVTALLGDQKVVDALKAAGDKTGEKMWQLPLVPEYRDHIKSRLADMKNIGRPGQAGTIIGGLFLQEFVGDTPWVHMDIAGPAFLSGETGYQPSGGTGIPVRTLLQYLESL